MSVRYLRQANPRAPAARLRSRIRTRGVFLSARRGPWDVHEHTRCFLFSPGLNAPYGTIVHGQCSSSNTQSQCLRSLLAHDAIPLCAFVRVGTRLELKLQTAGSALYHRVSCIVRDKWRDYFQPRDWREKFEGIAERRRFASWKEATLAPNHRV